MTTSQRLNDEQAEYLESLRKARGYLFKSDAIKAIFSEHKMHIGAEIIQKTDRDMDEGIESTTTIREPIVNPSEEHDLGSLACKFRKPLDPTHYLCYSLHPSVRVQRDGSVPKDICLICQQDQIENHFLNENVMTKSGENYKAYLRQKKMREQEEHQQRMEETKTQGVKDRKAERQPLRSKVDWGASEGLPDNFRMPDN